MHLDLQFTTEKIPRPVPFSEAVGCSGAQVEFYGLVRDDEQGVRISGLRYEIYQVMAEQEIRRILHELETEFPCRKALIIHRHGFIPVGEAAIYVGILAAHRQEAFGLLSVFMDRLKQSVPIWKTEAVPC